MGVTGSVWPDSVSASLSGRGRPARPASVPSSAVATVTTAGAGVTASRAGREKSARCAMTSVKWPTVTDTEPVSPGSVSVSRAGLGHPAKNVSNATLLNGLRYFCQVLIAIKSCRVVGRCFYHINLSSNCEVASIKQTIKLQCRKYVQLVKFNIELWAREYKRFSPE